MKVDFNAADASNTGIESLLYFFELLKNSFEVIKMRLLTAFIILALSLTTAKAQQKLPEFEAFREATQKPDDTAKLSALQQFVKDYPESSMLPLAKLQIFKTMVKTGVEEKDYMAFAEEAAKSFPKQPQRSYVLDEIAYTLANAGKSLEKAQKYAEEAVRDFPATGEPYKRAMAQHTLGWIQLQRSQYTEAIKLLEQAASVADSPTVYDHLAQAYEKTSDKTRGFNALLGAALVASGEDQNRRLNRLKAEYLQSGSEEAFNKLVDERLTTLLRDRALEQRKYEGVAPAWTLYGFAGEKLSLTDLKGKVVVLNWWGSWCPPCRAELPHYQRLNEKYKGKGVVFLGINWERPGEEQERIAKAKKYYEENKFTFQVLLDHDMAVGSGYRVQSFPTVFVIDREGQIRFRNLGYSQDVPKILEMQIEKLLGS